MSDEIILHKNQQQFDDIINDYEDKNKYKCKSCLFVGATKKLDYVCTHSLSLMYEIDVFRFEGVFFIKKNL